MNWHELVDEREHPKTEDKKISNGDIVVTEEGHTYLVAQIGYGKLALITDHDFNRASNNLHGPDIEEYGETKVIVSGLTASELEQQWSRKIREHIKGDEIELVMRDKEK